MGGALILFLLLGALEEENMGLRLVNEVVPPAKGLLHTKLAPLHLLHEAVTGDEAAEVLGQDDVAILKLSVKVLVAVQDLGLHLCDQLLGVVFLLGICDGKVIRTLRSCRCHGWGGSSF